MNANGNTTTGISPGDPATEIAGLLATAEGFFAADSGADVIVPFLYWPEVVGIVEGVPKVFRGVAEVLVFAHEFIPAMGRDVVFEITDPVILSGDLASTQVRITCRHAGGTDEIYRALYVWQRRGDAWKVIHEIVCAGAGE